MKFRTEEVNENRLFASLGMTLVRSENINGEKSEIGRGEKKLCGRILKKRLDISIKTPFSFSGRKNNMVAGLLPPVTIYDTTN